MCRALLLISILLALNNFAADEQPDPLFDGAHGLRCARRVDDKTIRVAFGASFVADIGAKGAAYRIVSPDDEDFQKGIRADKAAVSTNDDVAPPEGWQGKPFKRSSVTLTLPQPMKVGHRYWVEALGINGRLVTGGRAAAWTSVLSDDAEKNDAERNALGVRALELISPFAIELTVGPGLDAARFDNHPETIVLRCADDPDFKDGLKALSCGRRSRGDCFVTDGWPWKIYQQHELFAIFDKPLKQGHNYSLDLNSTAPLVCGANKIALEVDDRKALNPALKVNQIGYLPDAPGKYAYLGAWTGSLGAYDFGATPKFELRDAFTHQVVFNGESKLRHKAGEKKESAYKDDFSFENVCELDFSALQKEGSYYVCVPGAGRSFTFKIAPDVYVEPFKVMMTGVLHQRCGIEMKAPYSDHYRPACHRDRTELTDYVHATEAENFKNLPLHVVDAKKYDLYGGHHDAGDYNPRSHLEIAEYAFLLYEIKPAA
ncbi:MAG TPA: cellulase N-terminal Ig-like domain-containing protein, partial [Planctomycetota bacterium]|nr:cellulase N-terminal Ig-like domain-containing protein [Planctomycetota bacterium]